MLIAVKGIGGGDGGKGKGCGGGGGGGGGGEGGGGRWCSADKEKGPPKIMKQQTENRLFNKPNS